MLFTPKSAPARVGLRLGLIKPHMGVSQIRGTFLGVLILSIIVYWGLYWGTLILGKYHIVLISILNGDGIIIADKVILCF